MTDRPAGSDTADEEMLDRELASEEVPLGPRLAQLFGPTHDVRADTARRVDDSLRHDSALATGLDLLGLGWRTALELLTDNGADADGDDEGRRHG